MNYAFVMTAAPPGSLPWKELLLSGEVDLMVAQRAGELLAQLRTASEKEPALGSGSPT